MSLTLQSKSYKPGFVAQYEMCDSVSSEDSSSFMRGQIILPGIHIIRFLAKLGGKPKSWVTEFRDRRQDVWRQSAPFDCIYCTERGHAVTRLVEALRYEPEGREFDARWCKLEFFIAIMIPVVQWPWVRLSL